MTDEKLVIPQKNSAVPEVLPAYQQEEGNTEEQEEKAKTEAETEKESTTDPQEKMEGPISSIMQTIKEAGESNDVVSKKEADKKKDENM
jgi:hypothetical protein